jgi:predicted secreted protein
VSITAQTANFASLAFDITDVNQWKRWKPDLNAGTVIQVDLLQGATADADRPAPSITRE